MSNSAEAQTFMAQARLAAKQGDRAQAYRLLQRVVRLTPDDHMAWLWLASMTSDVAEAAACVNRAAQLQPDDPRVAEAQAWLARRQEKELPPARPARQRTQLPTAVWLAGMGLLVVCVLATVGVVAWRVMQSSTAVTTARITPASIPANQEAVAVATAAAPDLIQSTSTPKPYVPAKQIAANLQEPRPTWTVTPTPSPTPTPTPTWMPTWQSPGGKEYTTRPLGVGPNERWVDVDLSSQTLVAYEGSEPVFTTRISSGTADHPTVTGQFRIWLAFESQTMDGSLLGYDYYLENVPYVMYFFEDYALHGAFWHNNFGYPMSHGCVNLSPADAGWIFNWASVGTLVNVHE